MAYRIAHAERTAPKSPQVAFLLDVAAFTLHGPRADREALLRLSRAVEAARANCHKFTDEAFAVFEAAQIITRYGLNPERFAALEAAVQGGAAVRGPRQQWWQREALA